MGLAFRKGITDPDAYARSAFELECNAVASTGHGRNDQLNESSFVVGTLVGAGKIDRAEAEHALFTAAQASGYVGKDGAAAARSTIKSGLDKGIRKPREGLNGSAYDNVEFLRPKARLEDVPVPDWTPPDADGKPKFFAIGKTLPTPFPNEVRRHVYYRDGEPVRVKAKNKDGQLAWSNFYRVRRPDNNTIGWQAQKPDAFIPVPYYGPIGVPSPFGSAHLDDVLVWAEGEKDVDTLRKNGLLAFTFGSASDVPDCSDLLRDHHIILCADNDAAGEKSIPRRLAVIKDVAASIRTVRFADIDKEGADATDFFEAGGTAEEFVARAEPLEEPAADIPPPPDGPEEAIRKAVERLNGRYMMVNEDGKAVVFQPGFDPVLRRRRFDRLATKDLLTLHMNERVLVNIDDNGRATYKTAAEVWLRDTRRKQYINGVTFDPSGAHQNGVLNLWEGFALEPRPGDWSALREHIREVICDGDPVRDAYLMGWMARMLQMPAQQGEVAVVMKGGEGSGKGTLAKVLLQIIGHHGLAISNTKHLVGNFNSHLRDCVFLFADEAFFAGDKSHVGTLKSLITEPHLSLEGKFQNVALAANFLHIMMASNEEWVVPASLDARRFFVLEVPDSVKGDHGYFGHIWDQMDAGGYAAMLHDLLAYDLKNFNVRSVPTTDGLQTQRKLSLPTTESWWLDCLERGYVFKSKIGLHGELGHWHSTVSTELLFASYSEFAKTRGERRPLTREGIGRFFINLGARGCQKRNGIIGEQIADVTNGFGGTSRKAELIRKEKAPSYEVGSLDQARNAFSTTLRIDPAWEDFPDQQDESQGCHEAAKGTRF